MIDVVAQQQEFNVVHEINEFLKQIVNVVHNLLSFVTSLRDVFNHKIIFLIPESNSSIRV